MPELQPPPPPKVAQPPKVKRPHRSRIELHALEANKRRKIVAKKSAAAAASAVDALADDLLSRKPEAREHAIDAQRQRDLVDALNTPFDPALHALGKDGKPVLTEKGLWRKRREFEQPPPKDQESIDLATEKAGAAAAGTFFAVATMALGEEWRPTLEEQSAVTLATVKWFQAHEWGDLPPGAVVATVVLAYAIPRLQLPATQEKIVGLWQSLSGSQPRQPARVNGAIPGTRTAQPLASVQ